MKYGRIITAFFAGALYASGWWGWGTIDPGVASGAERMILVPFSLVVVFGSIFIAIFLAYLIKEGW